MDPLQNIKIVSKNLYKNIKLNEGTFVGKTINIHDVANQTKCHIKNPPTTQIYIKEKSKEAEQNNIEIFVMNETCTQKLGINTFLFSSFPVYTSFINPVLPKKRHIYYVITRNGIENDDAFIIYLAHYFRLGGVPKSNVLIYTEDNYDKNQHGLINIYKRTLINPQVSYDEFATFPKISITTFPLTEKEKKEQEEKKIMREERFSTRAPKLTTVFGTHLVPHFIKINRIKNENTIESDEEKLKRLKEKEKLMKKKENELKQKLLANEEKRKKVKEETKSEPKLEKEEINESNENTENYNDEKTLDNKRKRDKKYKEKYLKYRIKYEQLLKKTENIKI